ncbi:hypothetical protein CYMTET_17151 [Cymbomonas tetramitiformis]|uniref:Uncharacterized protein n=1 Tax=Cymbomonas tetramitiformis TaxID=36881 RepID=A0AAE0GAH0_9CHLO|nr:hypothetical protein CYMTET_17151 [Cymbomonas tetramitiformis]
MSVILAARKDPQEAAFTATAAEMSTSPSTVTDEEPRRQDTRDAPVSQSRKHRFDAFFKEYEDTDPVFSFAGGLQAASQRGGQGPH